MNNPGKEKEKEKEQQQPQARILVIDDDHDILNIVLIHLAQADYEAKGVDSGEKAPQLMETWEPHLVLLDINMPGMDGFETLEFLRQKISYVSVIFVSGNNSPQDVVKGLNAGADDYVTKPFDTDELLARIRTQLRIKKLNDELREANSKLKQLADTDDLTGLYNMRSLYTKLNHEIERARRFHRCVGAIMMDMDHFKSINDNYDHIFGSFVLTEVGRIIQKNIRSIDMAARYGGDEFLILLTEIKLDDMRRFCQRLQKSIRKYVFKKDNASVQITSSIGFTLYDSKMHKEDVDAHQLVKKADKALYEAKNSGRNCIKYWDFKRV